MVKILVILVMLAGITFLSWAEQVQWVLSMEQPVEGQPFTLTAPLPLEEVPDPTTLLFFLERVFPKELQVIEGPRVQTLWSRGLRGELLPSIYLSFTVKSVRSGRFYLPAATFEWKGREVTFRSLVLKVGRSEPPHEVPYDVSWMYPKGSFYVGEAIPLVLVVEMAEEVPKVEALVVDPPKEGILDLANDLLKDERNPLLSDKQGKKTALAAYLFTPIKSGMHPLPKARVMLNKIQHFIEGPFFTVQPIPETIRESRAVGKFFLQSSLYPTHVTLGSFSTLRLRLEGVGNLHWLRFPIPSLEEYTLFLENTRLDFKPSWEGYRGWREEVYRVYPKKTGALKITLPPFTFWDPEEKRTKELPFPTYAFKVSSPKETFVPPPTEDLISNLPGGEEIRFPFWANAHREPLFLLFLLPVLLYVGVELQVRKKPWIKQKGWAFYIAGWIVSIVCFLFLQGTLPQREAWKKVSIDHYNRGITELSKGNRGEGLYHLYESYYSLPNSQLLRILRKVEETYEIPFRLSVPIHRIDLAFFIFLGALHFFVVGILGERRLFKKSWIRGIGLVILLGS
ncbi:MAG: hypothetical protein SNJ78_05785, partial [Spirochaetales bacterium]